MNCRRLQLSVILKCLYELPNTDARFRIHLRAPDNSEVRLAVIADSVCRATLIDLIWVCPSLISCTVARAADFAWASWILGIDSNTSSAPHDRKIVSRASHATVRAISELEESLCVPLSGSALVGSSRQTSANKAEGCGYSARASGSDWNGAADGAHGEAGRDGEDSERQVRCAVVLDVDFEVVAASCWCLGWRGGWSCVGGSSACGWRSAWSAVLGCSVAVVEALMEVAIEGYSGCPKNENGQER